MNNSTKPESVTYVKCSSCQEIKEINMFYSRGMICRGCKNAKRRDRYKNDESFRQKAIKQASEFKHEKALKNQDLKLKKQSNIGLDNKQCNYCKEIKHKDRFRHNRLKCKDCERDEPNEKFKRYIRTRIYNCLRHKKKVKHSIEYLGCSSDEYFKWILEYNSCYNLMNHGKEWHIDHVIPLSKFDLNVEQQQLLAFNWRNTMPLSCSENLSKKNNIIQTQIDKHIKKLVEYHKNKNLELPQEYVDLFAKHLDAGSPLEPI